jgi:hypothetical protein
MIIFLRVLFFAILLAMLAVTAMASLDQGVLEAAAELWPEPWFKATLADAYFGFVTVFVWIAYKETTLGKRILWFVLLMALGNIAISVYVLIELFRLEPGDDVTQLLLRRNPSPAQLGSIP